MNSGDPIPCADVVAEARSWLNSPYVHQHRAKGLAVDCAGLVIGVARALRLVSPDFDVNGYTREPDGKQLIELCDRFMTRCELWKMKPGHVLVFAFERDPAHLGIVGDYLHGGLSIIQALNSSSGRGHVVEHRLDLHRRGWLPVQAYALPGVEP